MSKFCTILLVIFMLPGMLMAGTGDGSVSGVSLLFNGVILLVVLICFLVALKVFSILRGGELASGWQFIAISFMVLCLGQVLDLISTLELFSLNMAFVVAVRLAGVVLLMLGLARIKRVLS